MSEDVGFVISLVLVIYASIGWFLILYYWSKEKEEKRR